MTHDYSAWIGRRDEAEDVLDAARTRALQAALGRESPVGPGDPLPPLHHWLYFWDVRPPAQLGVDGHPARGGFLPPVSLPRRMWAGGRLEHLSPLRVGEPVRRVSTILGVETKSGRSGALVFVTVRHELFGPGGLALREEQDIVYRDPPAAGAPAPAGPPAPAEPDWEEEILPDPVLLFRYSALTMNGHRIHYDRPYAMGEEGYPGLVVHGPLQASLLADLAGRRLGRPVARFQFRGVSPAFDGAPLKVRAARSDTGLTLWTEQGGRVAMTATAE